MLILNSNNSRICNSFRILATQLQNIHAHQNQHLQKFY